MELLVATFHSEIVIPGFLIKASDFMKDHLYVKVKHNTNCIRLRRTYDHILKQTFVKSGFKKHTECHELPVGLMYAALTD
jgi:hypothetical protein